jgi:thioredoxin-related protein
MKNQFKILLIASALAILTLCSFSITSENTSNSGEAINWVTIEEAEALQKKENRPIYIDVYTTWCGPCKKMSRETFTNKKVIEMMNAKFYAVKFDAESNKTLTFDGHTYSSPGRNHSFTSYLQIRAFPTSVFIGSDLKTITSVAGYFGAREFLPMLEYIGDGHYKTKSWEEFTK